jgi:predicted nuclease of predicted toxin-antitoxin system
VIRFLADENVSNLVIVSLRSSGLDVMSVSATRAGASDDEVLATADREGRILITEDRDFGEMVVRQRLGVRGVILLELDRLSNAAEAARVTDVATGHMDKLDGNLLVVEPGRVRVRPLRR